MLSAPAHAISRRAAGVYACSGSRTQGSDGTIAGDCQTSASELARRAAVASPSRASVRSRSTSAARRLRAMRSASRSLVSHPSGTASASESVSSAQHRSTARLAPSRLAARLARVRQHARLATSILSPAVAVLLPLAVPIAAGASPAATRCMSLATYARTLVTARTRSVAASSRGRACVRRDAVCGQSAPPRLGRIDAVCETDIFGAFARLLSVGTSSFAIQFARPRVCVTAARRSVRSLRRRASSTAANEASSAATAFSGSRPYLVTVSCPRLLFEERCGYSGRVQRPQKALPRLFG